MNVFSKTKLWLDSDGTMLDFNGRVFEIFGMKPSEAQAKLGQKQFWRTLANYRQPGTGFGFYRSLEVLPGVREFFDAVKHLDPGILTGCPMGTWAPQQKVENAEANFPGTRIITCMAREKIRYLENPGDILVDDMTKFQTIWEEGGGVFVHHTSPENSLAELKRLRPEWFQ